jgi:hypothetical protein
LGHRLFNEEKGIALASDWSERSEADIPLLAFWTSCDAAGYGGRLTITKLHNTFVLPRSFRDIIMVLAL